MAGCECFLVSLQRSESDLLSRDYMGGKCGCELLYSGFCIQVLKPTLEFDVWADSHFAYNVMCSKLVNGFRSGGVSYEVIVKLSYIRKERW